MNDPVIFWEHMLQALSRGEHGALLCVVDSQGSSPGRKGFMMFVGSKGLIHGSIGGGSMEHKLVELTRSLLTKPGWPAFLRRQVHQAGIGQDRSGMICSGEQTIAFHAVQDGDHDMLKRAVELMRTGERMHLLLEPTGWRLEEANTAGLAQATEWSHTLPINSPPRIAIVGGGHVGLALSRIMNQLGFHVAQFDHREGLNTMEENAWAHEKHVVQFERIADHVPDDPDLFIALVSFGYRTDEVCLRALIRRQWRYLGLLGSSEKVRSLLASMRKDGFTDDELARVHAPIGVSINSRTPEEIAVSIAAEIIGVKNRKGTF